MLPERPHLLATCSSSSTVRPARQLMSPHLHKPEGRGPAGDDGSASEHMDRTVLPVFSADTVGLKNSSENETTGCGVKTAGPSGDGIPIAVAEGILAKAREFGWPWREWEKVGVCRV